MRTRFEPLQPWTRSHEKFVRAWGTLDQAIAERGAVRPLPLHRWLSARWGVSFVRALTVAQVRAAARQVNAWRAGVEGRVDGYREFPRQWRRNQRRSRAWTSAERGQFAAAWDAAAGNTASSPPDKFENLIAGTALAGLGRLMPTESQP